MKRTVFGKTTRAAALIMAVILLVSGVSFADTERDALDSGGLALTDVRLLDEFGNDLSTAGAVDAGAPVTLEYTYAPPVYDSDSGDALAASVDAGPVPLAVPTEIDLTDAAFSGAAGKVLGPQTAEIASFDTGSGNTFRVRAKFDTAACVGEKTLTFALDAGRSKQITLHFGLFGVLFADKTMDSFIVKSELYRVGANNKPDGAAIQNGDVVSKNDTLLAGYSFNIPGDAIPSGETGVKYVVPLPSGLVWAVTAGFSEELKASDGKKFGILAVDSDNKVFVQFIDGFYDEFGGTDPGDGIRGGYLYIGCKLDPGSIGNGEETAKIRWSDGDELEVKVKENQKRDAALQKEGNWDKENRRFHWKVTYTPGTKDVPKPLKLEDRFKKDKQIFLPDTFQINGVSPGDGGFVQSEDGEEVLLTYTIPDSPGLNADGNLVITYDTILSDTEVNNAGGDTKVSNTAVVKDNSGNVFGNSVTGTATAPKNDKNWITKDGKYIGDSRQIQWTVTIHTMDRNLQNLVLHDDFDEGLALEGEIQINGANRTDAVAIYASEGTRGFQLTFKKPYAKTYKVVYNTKVDDKYYQQSAATPKEFKNQAKLTFDWKGYGGSGTITPHTPPTVGVGVGADTKLIKKEGIGYDPATHQITWKVTVNPYKINLTEAKLTDDLKERSQSYVDGSFTCGNNSVKCDTGSTADKLIINVGNIGENIVTFTFKTELTDSQKDIYGGNLSDGQTYTNEIKLNGGKIAGVPGEKTDSAVGTQKITSTVVSKEAVSYDYTDNTIIWKVTVNQNQMPMKDVTLEDTLSEGQEYVSDSLEIDGSSASNPTINGKKITILIGDLEADPSTGKAPSKTVEFKTKVDVNSDHYPFKTAEKVIVANEIVLKRGEGGYKDVTASGKKTFDGNKVLSKSADAKWHDGYITYSVKINPQGISLSGSDYLIDQLPEGLLLDQDTVKLYPASVDPNGNITKNAQGNIIDLTGRFTYNAAERNFKILLPEGTKRYILEYTTDIIDTSKKSFTNKISLNGQSDGAGQDEKPVNGGGGGGGGGGVSTRKGSVAITKNDTMRNIPVAGAVFAIYYQGQTQELNRVTTDQAGKATFPALTMGKTYVIKEISAPVGYQPMADQTVNVGNTADTKNVAVTWTNDPVTGEIHFRKLNDWDRMLTGAEFEIVDKTTGSTYTRTVSSVDGVVLFPDVPFGTYEVKEVTAPPFHQIDATVYEAVIKSDGTFGGLTKQGGGNIEQVLNVSEKAKVTVIKTDKATGSFMPDVEFTIYDSRGVERGKGKTGADGRLIFDDLMVGETYSIHETTPAGYQSTPDKTVDVSAANHDYEVLWENERIVVTPSNSGSGGSGGSGSGSGSGGSSTSGNGILTPPSNSVEPGKPADPAIPADQPPADSTTREETPKDTPKEGAFDAPGDSHYVLLNPPEKGVVEIRTDGTWHYTPAPGFSGEDSFTVEIRLPGGETRTERVLVTILDEAVPKSPPNTGKYE